MPNVVFDFGALRRRQWGICNRFRPKRRLRDWLFLLGGIIVLFLIQLADLIAGERSEDWL